MFAHKLTYYYRLLVIPILLWGSSISMANAAQLDELNTAARQDLVVLIQLSDHIPSSDPKEAPNEEKEEETEENSREELREKSTKGQDQLDAPFSSFCSLPQTYLLQERLQQSYLSLLFAKIKCIPLHNQAIYLLCCVFLC